MSWLEKETDVLEKLHGALTEVGLPACGTKHTHKNMTTEITTVLINKLDQIIFLVLPGQYYLAIGA